VGETVVQCRATTPASRSLGVCSQKIFTGHLPLPVQNFSCLAQNWHSLNCSWRTLPNPVETAYELLFIEPGTKRHPWHCPTVADLEDLKLPALPENTCYVDLTTHPPYRQSIQTYTFYFNGTNRLLPTGRLQRFDVDHWAVVRPDPPLGMRLENVSASELLLSYSIPKQLKHFG
jgi:hypothetical protein